MVIKRLVRTLGQLQFKLPFLKVPINMMAQLSLRVLGDRIKSGPAAGLRINATGCNPGFLFGTSEPLEQETLVNLLEPGGTLYDFGANAGFYCLVGAKAVGPGGRVYAFEPTPAMAERIRENAGLNKYANIEVVEAAVGKTAGEVDFGITSQSGISNSLGAAGRGSPSIKVPCIKIDDFVRDHLPPSVILMDIEGAEIDALQGGLEAIRLHRPAIMVEVHWVDSEFKQLVRNELEPLGYTATTYDHRELPSGARRYHCLLTPPAVGNKSKQLPFPPQRA